MDNYDPNWRSKALAQGVDQNSPQFENMRRMESLQNSSRPSSSLSSPGFDFESAVKRAVELNRQANEPVVKSLESSIPETQSKFATQRTQLEGERQPLQDRYKSLIDSIKGNQTKSENRQTVVTSNELGKRGITGDSTLGQQEITNAVNPITETYSGMIKDTGLSQEADLRDLANRITGLTTQETDATRDIRNAIAQLQAGGNKDAIQTALSLGTQAQNQNQFNETKRLQEQQLSSTRAQQAVENALKEKQVNYDINKPYYSPNSSSTNDESIVARILGLNNQSNGVNSNQGKWVNANGQIWSDTKKQPIGTDPKTGQTVYSDGSKGWSKWTFQ